VKGHLEATNIPVQLDVINNDLLTLESKIVGLDTEINGMQSTM